MKMENARLKPVYLLVITIFLQSFSLLSIKLSTLQPGIFSLALLALAMGFILLRAILWQHLLTVSDLSRIYPLAGLVQILILVYAIVLFGEVITIFNVAGSILMLGGTYFISRQDS